MWQESCLPAHNDKIYTQTARTVVEVWDTLGSGANKKIFLGGNSISVDDLLAGNLNGASWKFTLFDGTVQNGYGVVRINWTPMGRRIFQSKKLNQTKKC